MDDNPSFEFLYQLHRLIGSGMNLEDLESKLSSQDVDFQKHLTIKNVTELRFTLQSIAPHLLRIEERQDKKDLDGDGGGSRSSRSGPGNNESERNWYVYPIHEDASREELEELCGRHRDCRISEDEIESLESPHRDILLKLVNGPKRLDQLGVSSTTLRNRTEFEFYKEGNIDYLKISPKWIEEFRERRRKQDQTNDDTEEEIEDDLIADAMKLKNPPIGNGDDTEEEIIDEVIEDSKKNIDEYVLIGESSPSMPSTSKKDSPKRNENLETGMVTNTSTSPKKSPKGTPASASSPKKVTAATIVAQLEAEKQKERGPICKLLLKGIATILKERPLKLDMLQRSYDLKHSTRSFDSLQKLGYTTMESFVTKDPVATRVLKVDNYGYVTLSKRAVSPPGNPNDVTVTPNSRTPNRPVGPTGVFGSPPVTPRTAHPLYPTLPAEGNPQEMDSIQPPPEFDEISMEQISQNILSLSNFLFGPKRDSEKVIAGCIGPIERGDRAPSPALTRSSQGSPPADGGDASDDHLKDSDKIKPDCAANILLIRERAAARDRLRERMAQLSTLQASQAAAQQASQIAGAISSSISAAIEAREKDPGSPTLGNMMTVASPDPDEDRRSPDGGSGSSDRGSRQSSREPEERNVDRAADRAQKEEQKAQLQLTLKQKLAKIKLNKQAEQQKKAEEDSRKRVKSETSEVGEKEKEDEKRRKLNEEVTTGEPTPKRIKEDRTLDSSQMSSPEDEICSPRLRLRTLELNKEKGSKEGSQRSDDCEWMESKTLRNNDFLSECDPSRPSRETTRLTDKQGNPRSNDEREFLLFAKSIAEVLQWYKKPMRLKELRRVWEDAHPGCFLNHYRNGKDTVTALVGSVPGVSFLQSPGKSNSHGRFVYTPSSGSGAAAPTQPATTQTTPGSSIQKNLGPAPPPKADVRPPTGGDTPGGKSKAPPIRVNLKATPATLPLRPGPPNTLVRPVKANNHQVIDLTQSPPRQGSTPKAALGINNGIGKGGFAQVVTPNLPKQIPKVGKVPGPKAKVADKEEAAAAALGEFRTNIRLEPEDRDALGGGVSLLQEVTRIAIQVTREKERASNIIRTLGCMRWDMEKHAEKGWIRYGVSSPNQAFPQTMGAWVSGAIRPTSDCGPITENLAAKLSVALRLQKWFLREKTHRPMVRFKQEEKNRLVLVHTLEQRDDSSDDTKEESDEEQNEVPRSNISLPGDDTAIEVCDDISFCRLIVALHREKNALGLSVGKRSMAVATTVGIFVIRLVCLERSYKPSLCYQMVSTIAGPQRPVEEDGKRRLPVVAGGNVTGLEDLLGNHWLEIIATVGKIDLEDLTKSINIELSLVGQAKEAWNILNKRKKENEAKLKENKEK